MTQLFDTKRAADYLGVTVRTMKKYIYTLEPEDRRLRGTLLGNSLVFTQQQLDDFRERHSTAPGRPKKQRRVGRPPKKQAE